MNMRKRVLLAEESEATRKVAETVLRENGFEVIAVSSGDKGLEVVEFSRPDLIVAGSELAARGRKLFYEQIQENPKTAAVPMLLFVNSDQNDLSLPSEMLINRPLDPRAFIERVNGFMGQTAGQKAAAAAGASNPLSDANLEDDFLDAALGLDRIDVMESEVMDKTQITAKKAKSKPSDKTDGYEADENTDSGKVESLIIREDETDIRPQGDKSGKSKSMSSSGKIEILDDAYGLVVGGPVELEDEHATHDYQWFINEMQKDNSSFAPPGADKPAGDGPDAGPDLTFSEPSSMVDPITPSPESPPKAEEKPAAAAGVDGFIDEFKREIEKIRSDEPESVTIGDDHQAKAGTADSMSWQDTLEKMTPEEISLFTRQFVSELADKIAQLIAAKIDSGKLLQLLRREIMSRLEKQQKSTD